MKSLFNTLQSLNILWWQPRRPPVPNGTFTAWWHFDQLAELTVQAPNQPRTFRLHNGFNSSNTTAIFCPNNILLFFNYFLTTWHTNWSSAICLVQLFQECADLIIYWSHSISSSRCSTNSLFLISTYRYTFAYHYSPYPYFKNTVLICLVFKGSGRNKNI